MSQPTLLIGTLFSFVNAGIYLVLGLSLTRRRIASSDTRLAWNFFILWWYALAGNAFATGMLSLLGGLGITDLPLFLTFTQVTLLSACAALLGLIYYLLYLFTGKRTILAPLTIFYIIYYVLLTYYYSWINPISVEVGRWEAALVYQREQSGPFFVFMAFLLVFPQIFGSVAYFTLFFRTREPTQKYRIALVSVSIFVVFFTPVLASVLHWSSYDGWQIGSRLLGLAATLAILLAYWPNRWIKQRLKVRSIIEDESPLYPGATTAQGSNP